MYFDDFHIPRTIVSRWNLLVRARSGHHAVCRSNSFKCGLVTDSGRVTGNPEVMTASEVKSHSSIDRFLVVFHSPTGMAETGLLACRSEKTGRVSRRNANTKDFLCSGFTMKTANWHGFRAIFGEQVADFSALQTVWRRGRHSNPRYTFEGPSGDVSVSCRESATFGESQDCLLAAQSC
jgi:hypothetical protein